MSRKHIHHIIVSVMLVIMLIMSSLLVSTAFAEQPRLDATVVITETYVHTTPDDDDGTAEEKEELIADNDEVPEGVDSTDDGIVQKKDTPSRT